MDNVGLTPLIKILDIHPPPHNLTMTLTRRLDREKIFPKNFSSHDVIIIHNASLIFTIMQIKPRLLIHMQTIM